MTRLVQTFVTGLSHGSIYALIAVGFVVIYKSTRVISFAQPALMVAGGVAVSYMSTGLGLAFPLAVILGVVGTAFLGLILERLAIRPMLGQHVFIVAIITLGLDIMIRIVANRFIGVNVRAIGDPWGLDASQLGGVVVQHRHVALFIVTAIVFASLFSFFRFSKFGLAMRAAAFDQETALAQGVSVGKVFAVSWAIAAGLAAIAGVFAGTGSGLDQESWLLGLKALPAIILGGLESLGGAIVGGIIVGLVESLFATYQPSLAPWLGNNFSVVSPYLVMVIVLLVRPYGLFGTPEIERV